MKYLTAILILFLLSPDTLAQQADTALCEIRGKVIDSKTKKPLDYVVLWIELNGIVKAQVMTDDEGNYEIRNLKSGEYTLKTSYVGYNNMVIQNIALTSQTIVCDVMMEANDGHVIRCPIIRRTEPLIDPEGKSGKKFKSEDIRRLPY